MSAISSQIVRLMIVYSTVYWGTDQRKYQSSASLAFEQGIHREPVNSTHKGPAAQKIIPFADVIMYLSNHAMDLQLPKDIGQFCESIGNRCSNSEHHTKSRNLERNPSISQYGEVAYSIFHFPCENLHCQLLYRPNHCIDKNNWTTLSIRGILRNGIYYSKHLWLYHVSIRCIVYTIKFYGYIKARPHNRGVISLYSERCP